MHLLFAEGIEKDYGVRPVLKGCSLRVGPKERVGLVGNNGAGKSTLIRIVTGEETADSGRVSLPGSVSVLSQHPKLAGVCVADAVRASLQWHQDLLRAYESAVVTGDTEEMSALQDRLDQVGWDLGHNIQAMLERVGAPPAAAKNENLSGGERRRVALARTLLSNADLLILDEPTNHLDVETIEWLEAFLKGYRGGVLLVTHDRYMLESVSTHIVEIENGLTYRYTGGYSDYLEERAQRQLRLSQAEDRRLKIQNRR